MPTALIADPIFRQHDPGWNHPESPDRYDVIWRAFLNEGLSDMTVPLVARLAEEEELIWCHTPAYVEQVRHEIESGLTQLGSGDTAVSLRSYEVARYAVGGVFRAVDAVQQGHARNAFCLVRPPGHHASAARGMGFCVFNNVALGARYAQRRFGVERVLIVDWDVHHGNGTQDIFYEDPSVFFFSTHEAPLYPFTGSPKETGKGAGAGTTMNRTFPMGAGRAEILDAYERELTKAMETFQPQLVMISAGFDGRKNDPLGHFALTDQDFKDLTNCVMRIAAQHADHRVVSVLEGGYELSGLASASVAHVGELVFGLR